MMATENQRQQQARRRAAEGRASQVEASLPKLLEFQCARTPRTGGSRADEAYQLVKLATRYVQALTSAQLDTDLKVRAARFLELTGPGSQIDQARKAARQSFEEATKKFRRPDGSLPRPIIWREQTRECTEEGETLAFRVRLQEELDPETAEAFLHDLEEVRWNLRSLSQVFEKILKLDPPFPGATAIRSFCEDAESLQRQLDRDDLWGSFLLVRCAEEFSHAGPGNEAFRNLLARIQERLSVVVPAIQEAAEAQMISKPESEPKDKSAAASSSWCQPSGTPPPDDEYPYGHVSGNQKDLAYACWPTPDRNHDTRRLHNRARTGSIWVRGGGHLYEVFFKTEKEFKSAEALLASLRTTAKNDT